MTSENELYKINETLSKIRKEEKKVKDSEKKDTQLTRKESMTLLIFIGIFSLAFFLVSNSFFYSFDIEISSNLSTILTHDFIFGTMLYWTSIASLFSYLFFCDKECFEDTFGSLKNIIISIFTFFSLSVFIGFSIGLIYLVILDLSLKLLSLLFSFQPFNFHYFNFFVFLILFACFILCYVRHFRKDLFKNEKEQQAFFDDLKNNKSDELKKLEGESVSIRKKVIDSIHDIDQLVYLSFLIKKSKLTELYTVKDTLEEEILKHEKYNSLLEYEQETLLNKIEQNKIIIKNE